MPFLKALPENRLDAHVRQRPRRVLATGAAAEIVARDQDRRACIGGIVKDVARLRPHRLERTAPKAGTGDRLQPMRRDDDIRVDILGTPRVSGARDGRNRVHSIIPAFQKRPRQPARCGRCSATAGREATPAA
jgi:hypothetical protein